MKLSTDNKNTRGFVDKTSILMFARKWFAQLIGNGNESIKYQIRITVIRFSFTITQKKINSISGITIKKL